MFKDNALVKCEKVKCAAEGNHPRPDKVSKDRVKKEHGECKSIEEEAEELTLLNGWGGGVQKLLNNAGLNNLRLLFEVLFDMTRYNEFIASIKVSLKRKFDQRIAYHASHPLLFKTCPPKIKYKKINTFPAI